MKPSHVLFAALAISSGAAFGGTADVRFIDPDRFSDLATTSGGEREAMSTLASQFQQLAARLPADQVLRVEVLDVDLAGDVRPTHRGNVRVNNGRADAPMIRLRYTLEAGGQVLKRGDERLTDLGYQRMTDSWRSTSHLHYEKRLLSQWFTRNFTPEAQASR